MANAFQLKNAKSRGYSATAPLSDLPSTDPTPPRGDRQSATTSAGDLRPSLRSGPPADPFFSNLHWAQPRRLLKSRFFSVIGAMKGRTRSRNQPLLFSRVEEACQMGGCRTLDEVVRYLHETHTDYTRLKQQSLTYNVRPAYIKLLHQTNDGHPQEEDGVQGLASCSRKRRLDNDYPQRDFVNRSESEIESGSNFYGGLATCSSSDAIHGDKVEQESDLFKSVLRECYGGSKAEKFKAMDKKSKVEDVRKEKVLPINEGGKKGGPRFRDLGGMKNVLDELRTKVLLYLWQREIPPWLGIRPMSGILLHGPPGCGKTTLAHAIANEAGLGKFSYKQEGFANPPNVEHAGL